MPRFYKTPPPTLPFAVVNCERTQILSAVNQGKLAGGIAQSGTLLAYQMERLPPRRVQVSKDKLTNV